MHRQIAACPSKQECQVRPTDSSAGSSLFDNLISTIPVFQ